MKRVIVLMMLLSTVNANASVSREESTNDELPYNTEMFDLGGNRIGKVDRDGTITDNYGRRQGYIQKDGWVKDNQGNRIYKIQKTK